MKSVSRRETCGTYIYAMVMPKIMDWKCTAKARAAAMKALGCSGHTEGDKTYNTSDYTRKHCKKRESTSNTVETAAEVLETDSSCYSSPPLQHSNLLHLYFRPGSSHSLLFSPPTQHQSSPPPPIGRQLPPFLIPA